MKNIIAFFLVSLVSTLCLADGVGPGPSECEKKSYELAAQTLKYDNVQNFNKDFPYCTTTARRTGELTGEITREWRNAANSYVIKIHASYRYIPFTRPIICEVSIIE